MEWKYITMQDTVITVETHKTSICVRLRVSSIDRCVEEVCLDWQIVGGRWLQRTLGPHLDPDAWTSR